MKFRSLTTLLSLTIASTVLIGCAGEPEVVPAAPVAARPMPPLPVLLADAGVPVAAVADPTFERSKTLAEAKEFGRRPDPFSLLAVERTFERNQQNERAASEYGGWFPREFEEPDTSAAERQAVVEPQPYRRLSGILLGNGVSALIEWEDGRVWEIVPGSQIPGTEWIVISIDEERAILRRGGSRLPKEIIVRLGPRVNEFTGGGGGGGNTGGGGRGEDPSGAEQGAGTGPSRPGAEGRRR